MSELFHAAGFFYNPKKREVLLHKRDGNTTYNPHKWAFFGGSSEGTEGPVETFVREIEEELAVQLTNGEPIPLCSYLNEESGRMRHIFYVLSEKPKSEMILGEGADFDWIPLDSVFEYDLSTKTIEDLSFFLQTL